MPLGKLPETIFLALVDADAFVGNPTKSMTNYSHYNMSEVSVRLNEEVLQTITFPYSFVNADGTGVDDYMEALHSAKLVARNPYLGN